MQSQYIDQRDGGYYVAGTRISLDSVVYSFNRGNSPGRILEQFPLIEKPAKVYGAIAFYLEHQSAIDAYLDARKSEFEASKGPPLSETNPGLWARLEAARARLIAEGRIGGPDAGL